MTVPLNDDPLLRDVPEVEGYKVLAPCVLYSKLGQGGMGAVYRGKHLNLEIDVAVKCLKRALAGEGPAFIQRFQREARLAASIHHQNLVQVYDVSHRNGVHYLVMEYVCGETARDRVVRKGPLKENEALTILCGAAAGLAEAHLRRIVHRDIKPDNILISQDGRVKVSDLGLAKAFEDQTSAGLTQGGVMGTPQYMAPEQWDDASAVGPATDVWALGATLYFLLTGADAIEPGSMQQVWRRVCLDPFPDVRLKRTDLSMTTLLVLERCVARKIDQRYADCGALLHDLEALLARSSTPLAFNDSSDTRFHEPLLSPPPPENLAKIRIAVDSQWQARNDAANAAAANRAGEGEDVTLVHTPPRPSPRPSAKPGTAAPSAATPAASPDATAKESRSSRKVLYIAGGVVLLVAGGFAIQTWRSGLLEREARAEAPTATDVDAEPDQVPAPIDSAPLNPPTEPTEDAESNETTSVEPIPEPTPEPAPAPIPELTPEPEPAPPAPNASFVGLERERRFTKTPQGELTLECEHAEQITVEDASALRPLERSAESPTTWRVSFDLAGRPEALLALTAQPGDVQHAIQLVLDDAGPVATLVGLEANVRTRELDLTTLRIDVIDVGSGVDVNSVRATLDGEPLELVRDGERWRVASAPKPGHGSHELELRAADLVGNEALQPIAFELDQQRPRVVSWRVNGVEAPEGTRATATANEPVEIEVAFDEPVSVGGASHPTTSDQPLHPRVRMKTTGHGDGEVAVWLDVTDEVGNSSRAGLSVQLQLAPRVPEHCELTADLQVFPDTNLARLVRDTRTGVEFALVEATPTKLKYYARRELSIAEYRRIRQTELNAQFVESLRARMNVADGEALDEYPIVNLHPAMAAADLARFGYRLPRFDEALHYARAGSAGPWSFALDEGRELEAQLAEHAWFAKNSSSKIQATGRKSANAHGLFDVHGNVREWCVDAAGQRYTPVGGSYMQNADACKLDGAEQEAKWSASPVAQSDTGFRPLFEAPRPAAPTNPDLPRDER